MGKGRRNAGRVAMGIAAVGVATAVAGVAATQPASISAGLVDLKALIVVGSSTYPSGAGNENFFQGKFNTAPYVTSPDDVVHVNFLSGPAGIDQALQAHAGEQNAILASGWGAANASLLLRQLDAQNDPRLAQTVLILDNDVAMPDGGFGTRYPWFALIGVNPLPTPADSLAAAVVDIGYQYDYNSHAPADVWNVVAAVNSLVAYLYRHLDQAQLDLPVNLDGSPRDDCGADTCGITDSGAVLACPNSRCVDVPPGDRVAAYVTRKPNTNTTFVTYTVKELPLTRLIRDVVPFGDVIADLTGPLLKVIVDSAYYGGNPIPADPGQYRPARLLPPPNEIVATVAKIPGAIQQGLTAALTSVLAKASTAAPPWAPAKAPAATRTPVPAKAPNTDQSSAAAESAQTTADSATTSTIPTPEPDEKSPPVRNVVRDGTKKSPPLRAVVRESHKAVPRSSQADRGPATGPEPVDTANNSHTEASAESDDPDTSDSDAKSDHPDTPSGPGHKAGDAKS